MLEVANLSVSYGQHLALEDVSLTVRQGEIVAILGANGAGKSSLLRAIGGMSEGSVTGTVSINGMPISGMPSHKIVEHGIAMVPEGRGIFPDLTVRENLLLGAYASRARADQDANMDRILGLFPKLAERRRQVVRTMSGGEQQMVAIGRAMMSAPTILMLDEPSLGLSPLLCKELFATLSQVRDTGLGILLVEQNAKQSLAIADRGYLLENARIKGEDTGANLANDPAVQAAYLGVATGAPRPAQPVAEDAPKTAADIAAEAMLPFLSRGSKAIRVSTDALIDEGIDDLVDAAARLQADRYSKTPRPVPATNGQIPDGPPATGSLANALREIEQAAARASRGSAPSADTPAARPLNGDRPPAMPGIEKQPPAPPRTATPPAELPEIEVWKSSPDLKIYRRSGGKLKRVRDT